MANSRKLKSSELEEAVAEVLARHVPPRAHLKLGFSGGADSRVLLHVLARLAPQFPFRLSCIHIHHGISPNADEWARFARRTARSYGLSCAVKKVDIRPDRKLGIEAAARNARYAAFATARADFILSAQHEDDQAETLLLQLVRGAGVDGLAAMPELREFVPGKKLLRPMLGISRAQIEAYARAHKLEWIEDESNADTALGRNFLRHEVLPRLRQLNPAASANLARSAAHLAEAAQSLDELAAHDAEKYVRGTVLRLDALCELSPARVHNLLRSWLVNCGAGVPSTIELEEIVRQFAHARGDAQIRLELNSHVLRRFRNEARLDAMPDAGPQNFVAAWPGEKEWLLPELGGRLCFKNVRGQGIAAHWLKNPAAVQVRLRQGGEAFRPDARRPRRSLKKLFQEQGVAPWERDRLPLLYCADRLLFVPHIGIAAEARAAPDEQGLQISWRT